jgi:hypothetical protein
MQTSSIVNSIIIHQNLKLNAVNHNRSGESFIHREKMHEKASREWRPEEAPTND